MRDLVSIYRAAGPVKLFPYARDVFYHPNGMLSMTIQIYDEDETNEFSFGFRVAGELKAFLDQTLIGSTVDMNEEDPSTEEGI